jgi:alkylation response protein AidB-like acyl-CoA dehydrogenase
MFPANGVVASPRAMSCPPSRSAAMSIGRAAAAPTAAAPTTLEHAAETAIQVHGGIGFTWEHDAHLYWRRAKVDRLLLGDEAEHLDTVARLVESGALTP